MNYSEDQMREIFYQEMREVFEHIDSCILFLERTPGDLNIIKNLFREVHTLKGSSGVFGLKEIADLTHYAEDTLDKMRDGVLSPTEEVFSILLQCFDRLKDMMMVSEKNGNMSTFDNSEIIKQLTQINSSFEKNSSSINENLKVNAIEKTNLTKIEEQNYIVEITAAEKFYISGIDPITLILNCRDISSEKFSINTNFSSIPSLEEIEPENCYFEFILNFSSKCEMQIINEMFEFAAQAGQLKISQQQNITKVNQSTFTGTKKTPTENQNSSTVNPFDSLIKNLQDNSEHNKQKQDSINKPPLSKQPVIISESNDFVRLKKEKLDQLMNLVGELITMKNLFVQLSNRLEEILPENEITRNFKEGTAQVTRLSSRMQESVMNARMVPIGTIFSKYTRLVRDISKQLNKKVNLVIQGEDTELDKTVSEAIGDPIMHLIRNSIDHGIETVDMRKEKGKPEAGTLLLKSSYEGNNVKIIVRDDGNGIDLDRVKNKAVQLGLISEDHSKTISKKEIIEFIFHSGFSTASEVSDISGRGVGMDVVRNNIRRSSGSIFVDTTPGEGTEFRIILPLSLAVIDALLVGIDGETYALPQESIIENIRADPKDIMNLNSQQSINLRGEIIPILKLNEVISIRESILDNFILQEKKLLNEFNGAKGHSVKKNDEFHLEDKAYPVVIVQVEEIKVGILVDILYRQEQIMIKPLGGFLSDISIFTGACIRGNGSVILVIEPKELYLNLKAIEGKESRVV